MPIPPIRVVISGVDRFSSKVGKMGKKLDQFSKKATKVGKAMTVGITLPIVGLGAASVAASTQMNEGMAKVATLIPGNTERVEELKRKVQEFQVATGRMADDVTGGLFQTISAFGDSAETAERLNIALRASVAGSADTQASLSMLSGVTKAFGDTSATALKKVSDLAFKTNELGETTFPELAANMGKVNSIAVALGLTQEELFATIATGTGPLGNTADVTTKVKGAMVALMKPTTTMEKAFEALGVETGQQLVKQRGFVGALQAVSKVADINGANLTELFGRTEALSFALAVGGPLAEQYQSKLEAMGNAAGSTDKAFREQTEGINKAGFTMKQAAARAQILGQQFGDVLAPMIMKVLDVVTPFVSWLGKLNERQKTMIVVVGIVAAAIGPLILLIGGLAGAVAHVATAIKILSGALTFLAANPVGAIIVAIGALIAIVTLMIFHWDKVKKFFIATWDFLKKLFQSRIGVLLTIMFPFIGLPIKLAANWDKVVAVFKKVVDWGKKVARAIADNPMVQKIVSGAQAVAGVVGEAGRTIGGGARDFLFNEFTRTNNAEVKVKVEGPPGTRVERTRGDVDLETETGALLAGAQ